jgi:hypothetical protein
VVQLGAHLADFWLDYGTYIDFSSATLREKFISANGMPMYLGADGSLPTGSSPEVFLSGDTADWHLNKGTGGGFVENGELTESLSQPGRIARVNAVNAVLDFDNTEMTANLKGIELDDSGNYAYIGSWSSDDDLYTFNVSDPANIVHESTLNDPELRNFWEIITDGDYAYGCTGTNTGPGGALVVFDISDRANPSILAELQDGFTCFGAGDLVKHEDYVYTANFNGDGISIVDVSNPSAPIVYSSVTNAGMDGSTGITIDPVNGYAYVGAWNIDRFAVVDIDPLNTPTYVTNITDASFGEVMDLRIHPTDSSIVYVGNNTVNNISIVDVSNPAAPSVTGTITDGNLFSPSGLDIFDDTTMLIGGSGAVLAYDITDPDAPVKIDDHVDLAYTGRAIDANSEAAFTTSDNNPYYIVSWDLDVLGCANPTDTKGSIIYNTDELVMQYCNGVDWVAMGPIGGSGGGGCTVPAGNAGDILFSSANKVMQYCNSQDWVAIGKPEISEGGLIGHWRLDETSGLFIDSSVSGNNGTGNGGVAYASGSGKVLNAAGFDGVDDYISMGDVATFAGLDAITVSIWIKTSGSSGETQFFNKSACAGASEFELFYGWPTANGSPNFNLELSGSADVWTGQGSYAVNDGQWHMITGTWSDGSNLRLYIDGELEVNGPVGNGTILDRIHPLSIGACSNNYHFEGQLDDARIYNRALSASEINALYHATR